MGLSAHIRRREIADLIILVAGDPAAFAFVENLTIVRLSERPRSVGLRMFFNHCSNENTAFGIGALTVLFLMLGCLYLPGPAAGREQAPSVPPICHDPYHTSFAPDGPGLDPSRPFYVDIGPYQYAVPWKYLQARPRKNLASCKLNTKSMGIVFSLSDGSAPETDRLAKREFSPLEQGPSSADPMDSVIEFSRIQYYKDVPPPYFDPNLSYKNILKIFSSDIIANKINGMDHVQFKDPSNRHNFWYQEESDTAAFISCVLTRYCQGFIDLKDKNIAASFIIPMKSISKYRGAERYLRDLLNIWEVHR
jgi:hypothetical protein